jgi:hypothetical protein
MSERLKHLFGVVTVDPAQPIVVPKAAQLPVRSLALIDAEINQAYAELENTALTAVEKAITIGKRLKEAKAQLKHGEYAAHITATYKFTKRWGQRCVSLADHEAEIMQEIARLRTISSHLSLAKAFEHIGSLDRRPKLRRKKPKPT